MPAIGYDCSDEAAYASTIPKLSQKEDLMKSIKWMVTILLISLIMLVACKDKEDTSMAEDAGASKEEIAKKSDNVDEDEDEKVVEPLFDVEAIIGNLGDFVLRPSDMVHAYYIPEEGEQHLATVRLIQNMGEIEAKTYVKETGRIDGWWTELHRTNKEDFVPSTFESSIEFYESAEGAQAAMTPTYYSLYQDETREYIPVDGGCDLGDNCKFFYSEKENPTTEIITAQYNIAFTYRNSFVWVMARGLTLDMEADYVLDVAKVMLAKLEKAPVQ
jgi:hypothetical protein